MLSAIADGFASRALRKSLIVSVWVRLMPIITSPFFKPRNSAGEPFSTLEISTPFKPSLL